MQSRGIRWLEKLISRFQLEAWMAVVFSTFFFVATRLDYATDQIGWVAFVIYLFVVAINRSLRALKEREIAQLRADVENNIRRLRHLLEKAQKAHSTQMRQRNELERAMQTVEDSRQQLLGMSDLKNKFMATLSHELRTPVTAIQESVNLISEGIAGVVQPQQKKFLEIAQVNIKRLTTLLNNLLDLSQLELGGMKTTLAKVHLDGIVREAINIHRPQARKQKLELVIDIRADLLPVLADRQRVVQVVGEILANAIRFTPVGGKVGISARRLEGTKEVEVCVWDTGSGMAPEHVDQLFGGYHQLKHKEDYVTPGAGLGLGICRAIVTQMGGSIWAESQQGQGSRFYFTLLCYSDKALLKNCFQESVKDALLRNAALILLDVQIQDYAGLVKRYGLHGAQDLLYVARDVVMPCFRVEDRAAMDSEKGECYVLLVSVDSDLKGRLHKVDEYLKGKTFVVEKNTIELKFSYGMARFPKDGADLGKLMECIENQLNSGGIDIRTLPMEGAA